MQGELQELCNRASYKRRKRSAEGAKGRQRLWWPNLVDLVLFLFRRHCHFLERRGLVPRLLRHAPQRHQRRQGPLRPFSLPGDNPRGMGGGRDPAGVRGGLGLGRRRLGALSRREEEEEEEERDGGRRLFCSFSFFVAVFVELLLVAPGNVPRSPGGQGVYRGGGGGGGGLGGRRRRRLFGGGGCSL